MSCSPACTANQTCSTNPDAKGPANICTATTPGALSCTAPAVPTKLGDKMYACTFGSCPSCNFMKECRYENGAYKCHMKTSSTVAIVVIVSVVVLVAGYFVYMKMHKKNES